MTEWIAYIRFARPQLLMRATLVVPLASLFDGRLALKTKLCCLMRRAIDFAKRTSSVASNRNLTVPALDDSDWSMLVLVSLELAASHQLGFGNWPTCSCKTKEFS